jgi:UDP-N-acetylmuramate: L-alanyl-gamma-D-glutamyl-meso-diaminopimelate ligase
MGGVAAIAKAAGYRVTGSDLNVYPPMSDQLTALGVELIQGYGAEQLDLDPDIVVVGNALSRGRPVIEALLDRGVAYTSGPQWLAEHVLRGRHVLAVAGTHGKTTTSSMLAWILEHAGLAPGFLIGGVPSNFDATARLGGAAAHFVIEADEYDTAFFDKRAKFVHYGPRTLILNNLEYDHADIYPDIAAIRRQFSHLLRTVPQSGRIVRNGADRELEAAIAAGCWTPCQTFGLGAADEWSAALAPGEACGVFTVLRARRAVAEVRWQLLGEHNVMNALAAIAAADHVGVAPERAALALAEFRGVKRRMEIRGTVDGVTVYDDFAHHPTAIATTLGGLRARLPRARIVAVLEPRSNTMKLGVHRDELAPALAAADQAWFLDVPGLDWNLPAALAPLGARARIADSVDALVAAIAAEVRPGDQVLVMSNGGFGGLHEKLLAALHARQAGGSSRPK